VFQGVEDKVFGNLHIALGTSHWETGRKFPLFLPCIIAEYHAAQFVFSNFTTEYPRVLRF